MMRLKQGDRVEVMNKMEDEDPVSWYAAEILSGNGHTYHVQYDSYLGRENEKTVHTVSRKFVRPCQPLVRLVEDYNSGDTVEVFYDNAWRTANILKICEGKRENKSRKISLQGAIVHKQYLVRLLGCAQELNVDETNIRMKEIWRDDKWIPLGKSSRGGEDVTASKPSTSVCYQKMNSPVQQFNARMKKHPRKEFMSALDENPFPEPHNFSGLRKRISTDGTSFIEERYAHTQKFRAIEKHGRKQRLLVTPVLEKVDAVAYPREILGDQNMHASFKLLSTGYNRKERANLNDVLGYPVLRNPQLESSDSDTCSVGSCSVTDQGPNNLYIPSIPLLHQETGTHCSDAESFCEREFNSLSPEEIEVSIHRLELHAYRRTLEALYASGPLSWEQEAMLTNLRIMLHVSNDEHLMELKNLISTKTAISVR